jgi:transcriptional regulator NrdR family protein
MVCIQCGADTQVSNSRLQKRVNHVWRRRKCLNCGLVFTTTEETDLRGSVTVRDRDGRLAPFSRDRLLLSIHASLQHRPAATGDASALADTIIARLLVQMQHSVIEDTSIVNTVAVVLSRFDKAAAVHYQAFHPLG